MPRYRRPQRRDPARVLVADILGLILGVFILVALFGGIGYALIFAILVGGGGLILLGVVWLAMRLFFNPAHRQARMAKPFTVASPAQPPWRTATAETPSLPASRAPVPGASVTTPLPVMSDVHTAIQPPEPDVEAHALLSALEKSFFWTLNAAVRDAYYIFPQVPLRELARLDRSPAVSRDLSGMLSKGVVDFILADSSDLNAVLAIEFDDPSHRLADAAPRDRRKDDLLQMIGLPVLRIPSKTRWNAGQLRQEIESIIAGCARVTFLSDAERLLFHALREARPDWFVFPLVPLKRIIRRKVWLSKEDWVALETLTVDVVIAHPRYLGTLLVVEMDDADSFAKAELLERAGVRRLCIGAAGRITSLVLREQITRACA